MLGKYWEFLKKEVIANDGETYLIRYKIARTPWFGVYLHKIVRSDSDRDLHDHPFNFLTVLLKGSYQEEVHEKGNFIKRKAPTFIYHRAEDLHRLTLEEDKSKKPKPVWTLFFVGRRRRDWGFQTDTAWIHSKQYIKQI